MSSVGQILREERQRQGLELPKIAQQTRINLTYLQAIEGDEPAKLPGSFFYRSFVRQYGEFLGVDSESLDAMVEHIAATQSAPTFGSPILLRERLDVPPLPRPRRSSDSNRFTWALILLVIAMVGSAGLYMLWQRMQEPRREPPPAAAIEKPAPASSPSSTPGSVPPAASPPVPSSSEPSSTAAQTPPGGAAAPVTPVSQAAPGTAPAVTTPAPPSSGTASPAPPNGPVLEFMATEDVWVSATADGKEVVSRVLKPGESRTVRGVEKVSLLTGNAGGLVVTANGKLIENIGPRGQVRIVEVTPQGVEVRGPASKKPAAPENPPRP